MTVRAAVLVAWVLASGAAAGQQPDSIWYQDRGAGPQPPPPGETRLDTALRLAATLRDGRVPGFYDGQFAAVKERFDDLAAIARDPDLNHVLRIVAVMALQEAGDGERVREALDPLLLPADDEFTIQYLDRPGNNPDPDDEDFIREVLAAELSQHARFSLAKDGQPGPVLEKIKVMENRVHRKLDLLLDPTVNSDDPRFAFREVLADRLTIFEIGYHYQQFDDYVHAAEWFELLCRNLPGHRETQMAHYNLACIEALSGRPDSAMEHLRSAHAVGFTNVAWLQEDGDLASLRDRPDFAALVALMRNQEPPGGPGEAAPGSREPPGPADPPGPR